MNHRLAEHFAGASEITAEIESREPDTADHLSSVRATVESYHPRRLHLTVDEVLDETDTTKTFRLRRADGSDLPPFLAGQYVAVFVDGTSRPFAISSGPDHLDHYDLTVRRVPGGRISNLLIDTVVPGDPMLTSGPMGTFHHNPLFHGDDVVFVAGGSGVAPAMSMIRDIVDQGLDRRLHLVYGSRTADDVIFRTELEDVAARHANIRVDLVVQDPPTDWAGPSGLITAELLASLVGDLDGRMVYVCGPQGLYPYVLGELAARGHPRHRIRFEANGAPADPTSQPHWPAGVEGSESVSVTTRTTTFSSPRNRPLLDALEDQGIRLEVACRSGECSLCRVRVLKGAVHNAEEARLRMSDEQAGIVHSCVAYPLTDVEIDV